MNAVATLSSADIASSGPLSRLASLTESVRKGLKDAKNVSRAVVLAIGVILGYSSGAVEATLREGHSLPIDLARNVLGINPPVSSDAGKLIVAKSQIASLKSRVTELVGEFPSGSRKLAQGKKNPPITEARAHSESPKLAAAVLSNPPKFDVIPTTPLEQAVAEVFGNPMEQKILVSDKAVPSKAEKPRQDGSDRYVQLRDLAQAVQSGLSLKGAEIRVQEQSGGKHKIWVEYGGKVSKAFFAETPKFRSRLTESGMKAWAEEKVAFLAKASFIEQVAAEHSVQLAKTAKSSQTAPFSLKLAEVEGKGKIRFLLTSLQNGKAVPESTVDFTMVADDVTRLTLARDFTIAKKRSLVSAEEKVASVSPVLNPEEKRGGFVYWTDHTVSSAR
jgi:hypothetical protein